MAMDRKPGHLTKSVQEIAGSLFWIKVKPSNNAGCTSKLQNQLAYYKFADHFYFSIRTVFIDCKTNF